MELEQRLQWIQDSLAQTNNNDASAATSTQPVDFYIGDSINTKVIPDSELREMGIEVKEPTKKYVFVKIKTEKPDFYGKIDSYVYTSEIIEVENLTEREKHRLMDKYLNQNFSEENYRHRDDKVIDRKILVFDSYEAASKERFSTKNEF